jgi:MFS transporter, NNP family, nitrate/nitrite transporter
MKIFDLSNKATFTLHMTWVAFFLTFLAWFSFAPFATTIAQDLGLTIEQLKVLSVCNLALTVPARIVTGIILDRFGARVTFSGVLLFTAMPCMLFATATSFEHLVIATLINSIVGAGFVVGVRILADWFSPKDVGIAQGIYGGWGNFGAAASQIILPPLAIALGTFTHENVSWRLAIALVGIVCSGFGIIYWLTIRNVPDGKVLQKPKRVGALEVTSLASFWAMSASDFFLLLSIGLLILPLQSSGFLDLKAASFIWLIIFSFCALQFYKGWVGFSVDKSGQPCLGDPKIKTTFFVDGCPDLSRLSAAEVNRQIVSGLKKFLPSKRFEFRQIALLSFTYFTNFGSQIAVLSVLPSILEKTFNLSPIYAGLLSSSYPFLNLVSRPSGGLISDRLGSRKWVMVILTLGIALGYFAMARINSDWSLGFTITAIALSAFFVQAAAGATFSIVPLIKKEVTGQIAGTVGAYGNVGGVVFLTVNNYTNWQTLFNFMGVAALVCASCCVFFLHVPPVQQPLQLTLTNLDSRLPRDNKRKILKHRTQPLVTRQAGSRGLSSREK